MIPTLLIGLGVMPYTHFYHDGPRGFTNEFRERYQIFDNVVVERYTEPRFTYVEDFIILPLLIIIEGGVQFPMNPFTSISWNPMNSRRTRWE